jgi:predicted permease
MLLTSSHHIIPLKLIIDKNEPISLICKRTSLRSKSNSWTSHNYWFSTKKNKYILIFLLWSPFSKCISYYRQSKIWDSLQTIFGVGVPMAIWLYFMCKIDSNVQYNQKIQTRKKKKKEKCQKITTIITIWKKIYQCRN